MARLTQLTALGMILFACATATAEVDFDRDVRPILSNHCFHCHGPDESTREADLRLDVPEGLEYAVTPGESAESELFVRVTSDDDEVRMPPPSTKRRLTEREISVLREWIDAGAKWKEHWAYVAPQRPPLPQLKRQDWPRNPLDHFILARQEREGLSPSVEADRATLIRRVTLDLTGLPPTPEEVAAFLRDQGDQAYERLVDRLLSSPRYGERMAWDWLDAARYADTNGFQADPTRQMWPWRDWVVAALNRNMPYDQFTIEQLAGDLLPNATPEQRLATAFNRNHTYNGEGGRIPEEGRVENVMDRAETTATVWLGVTMTCCRCHDHKYDPFSNRDYYSFFAFFNNTSEPGGVYGNGAVPPVLQYASPQQREAQAAYDRLADEVASIEAARFAPAAGQPATPPAPDLPDVVRQTLAVAPRARNAAQWKVLADHFQSAGDYSAKLTAAGEKRTALEKFPRLPSVMIMDELAKPRETFILTKGLYNKPTEKVSFATPARLPPLPKDVKADRAALARWLMSAEHPLTARVTVNRYWQLFFGTGLVKTSEDFGSQGERPSHPELLDWLAVEFRESGWNVKALHRLIVTSAAYRQSSRTTPALVERDPANRWLARGPRHRLPSWMLRDQVLALGGLLVEQLGGEPVRPYQPEGIWQEATFGKINYVQDHGEKLYRRSLYTFWRRIVGPTSFFDVANRQVCSVKPPLTNSPLHALTTLNDPTFVEAARAMALTVMTAAPDADARLKLAFQKAAARAPRAEEQAVLKSRLEQLQRDYEQDPTAAEALLKVGESPRDARLAAAEHAAYTALCLLILNLDEVLTKQ